MATYTFPAETFTVPGDPEVVRESGSTYGRFSTTTAEAASGLRGMDSSSWVGTEGDLFRGQAAEIPPHLDTAHSAFGQASTALGTFAGELAAAQRQMAGVRADAEQTFTALQAASTRADQLQEPSDAQVEADPQAQTAYDDLKLDLDNRVGGLEADFDAQLGIANGIRARVDEAARTAGNQIRAAGRTSPTADQNFLQDWAEKGGRALSAAIEGLKGFIAEHAGVFRVIADVLRVVGIALVVIGAVVAAVSWWTGIGAGVGGAIMTAGGLLWGAGDVLDTTVDWAEGKISGTELLISAGISVGLSLIPFGLGKAVKGIARIPPVRRWLNRAVVPAATRLAAGANRWLAENAIPKVWDRLPAGAKDRLDRLGLGPVGGQSARNVAARTGSVDDIRRFGGDVDYGTVLSSGRHTGVRATITPDMVQAAARTKDHPVPDIGSHALRDIEPPGWDQVDPTNRARMHLLGGSLGGSGDVEQNLVAGFQRDANTPVMSQFERLVGDHARAGETIDYSVTPVYDNPAMDYPSALRIDATGGDGFWLDVTIENTPEGMWTNNLGDTPVEGLGGKIAPQRQR